MTDRVTYKKTKCNGENCNATIVVPDTEIKPLCAVCKIQERARARGQTA